MGGPTRQAVAPIGEARSGVFPTVGATCSAIRSHEGSTLGARRGASIGSGIAASARATSGTTGGTTRSGTSTSTSTAGATTTSGGAGTTENTFTPGLPESWNLDLWGRLRRQIRSDVASAQASGADVDAFTPKLHP